MVELVTQVFLQFLCLFLCTVGLLFVVIEARTRFDRSFLYFGLAIIFLCGLTSLDLWIIPDVKSIEEELYWQKIFHVFSCGFYLFSLWYVMLLTRIINQHLLKVWVLLCMLTSGLFFFDQFLVIKDAQIVPTPLYFILFVPLSVAAIVSVNVINGYKLFRISGVERKELFIHLLGLLVLSFSGIADLVAVAYYDIKQISIPSFLIMGAFVYGLTASVIFIERFMVLLNDRQEMLVKLQSAYQEMEEASALRKIGESTSIINHELRNYMTMVSGQAELLRLKETLTEKGRERVESIIDTTARIIAFSQDILEMSKSKIIKNKHPIKINELIVKCIDDHFSKNRDVFVLEDLGESHMVHGDWGKLEQVFVNLFKNALEAAADTPLQVRVQCVTRENTILIVIEDNGQGCDGDQLTSLFKAFYTTKKGKQGTGLGMSISKNIIESHGGRISAYSKNEQGGELHGLVVQLSFPRYETQSGQEMPEKSQIVLIKEGVENLEHVLPVFQNVYVNPHIIQNVDEMKHVHTHPEDLRIIGTLRSLQKVSSKYPQCTRQFLISQHESTTLILQKGDTGGVPEFFSEEYILTHLL